MRGFHGIVAMVLLVCCVSSLPGRVEIGLERSGNLRDWEAVPVTPEMLGEDGWIVPDSEANAAFFRLRIRRPQDGAVPEGMVLVESDTQDLDPYLIGEFEVTWEEWMEVRAWAADEGYDLAGAGNACAGPHPVHSVTWHQAVKWCNARSEMEGLTPVYTVEGEPYRTGISLPLRDGTADGYRLPTVSEWNHAASGGIYSQGYTFSGSNVLDEVAWYWDTADGAECNMGGGRGTWPVGLKIPNELGLYDMTGNVSEWCWDLSGDRFALVGGAWNHGGGSGSLIVGSISFTFSTPSNNIGFRIARNVTD